MHPACKPAPAGAAAAAATNGAAGTYTAACLLLHSAALQGRQCTVLLPAFLPALIRRLVPADAATLAQLGARWASLGLPLPDPAAAEDHWQQQQLPPYLVEVCFSDDPDAPGHLYPPACVLGKVGLFASGTRLAAPAVQAAMARLAGVCLGWRGGSACR